MKKIFLLPLLILLVIGSILIGCGTTTPTSTATTTPPASTTPTTTTPTSTTPTSTTPTSTSPTATPTKTFAYGLITDLTGSLGLQNQAWFETINAMINANGGLKIGNDYYKMQVITYSNDNDNTKAVSAANRLVFQDKVSYIIAHQGPSDLILPITDPANVLCFNNGAIWNSGLLEKWNYSFTLLGQGTHEVSVAGWLIDNYPEMKGPNGLAFALPDNSVGHIVASLISYPYKAQGCTPQLIYFPADQRDLSSLGTKINSLNPAWYFPNIGKVEDMALASSAAYDAGYRGHYFTFLTSDVGLLSPIFKPEVLEGFICAMSAMEYGDYNGCMTPLAEDMKDAYVAKYGKWDYADYMTTPCIWTLMAALQQVGDTDVQVVAEAMHTGINGVFVPDGTLTMISRPDMNLSPNTIDAVMDNSLKQIKNKQPVLLVHFGPDQSLVYERRAYPPLPIGATPTIVPPL